jgi:dihydrofolate reductase
MRRIRYAVAMSLDGYIAGPEGEADWIVMDPEIDFGAVMAELDTYLMGRRTFEGMQGAGGGGGKRLPGVTVETIDVLGRPTLALGITDQHLRQELLLDAKTFAYAGQRP